jgi:hypothetical protein
LSTEGVGVKSYIVNTGLFANSGTSITRIGVICHELGHFLGLPDLNDGKGTGQGIGNHGLMGNSWGFDSSQKYPPLPSAWAMDFVKWETPTVITNNGRYNVTKTGVAGGIHSYKIGCGFPTTNEYLLVQYRQDDPNRLLDKGIAIYHVDNSAIDHITEGYPGLATWPKSHYKVAVLQADGLYQLEKGLNRGEGGDLYKKGMKIGRSTTPSTKSYSQKLVTTSTLGVEIEIVSDPTGDTMTFVVNSGCVGAVIPLSTSAPTRTPTTMPTASPTQSPTLAPTIRI